MDNKYIIINKTAILERIEELEKELQNLENLERQYRDKSWDEQYAILPEQIDLLKAILSQSTPLLPEIEKVYDKGSRNHHSQYTEEYDNLKQKDISNLNTLK